jgi:hypothetical protein
MKTQQATISEVSLIYRSKVKASDRPQVKCSRDAYNLFMEHWNHDTIEHVKEFKLMLQGLSHAITTHQVTLNLVNQIQSLLIR